MGKRKGLSVAAILREVPGDVGHLSEVEGTARQQEAGRVAHYLWSVADLDYQELVEELVRFQYTPVELAWACRWGPPLSVDAVAQGLEYAMSLRRPREFGRQPWGDVLWWLYSAGVTGPEDLVTAAFALGVDDPAWVLPTIEALTPLDPEVVLVGYARFTASKDPFHVAMRKEHDIPRLTTAQLARLADEAGMLPEAEARKVVSRNRRIDHASLERLQPQPAEVTHAWTEFFELREDGLERYQAAELDDEVDQLREAFGVLNQACQAADTAIRETRSAGNHWVSPNEWSFPFTYSSLLMTASDCHRDTADIAQKMGDLDGAIRLARRALAIAKPSGDEHGAAKAYLNLGVQLMRRASRTDLNEAEGNLELAGVLYHNAGLPQKLLKVRANLHLLSRIRKGEHPSIIPAGSRSTPWIPAHEPGTVWNLNPTRTTTEVEAQSDGQDEE
jgi:tetratricopeptide (TPR) repeat protein